MKITQNVVTKLVITPEEIAAGDISGIIDRFSSANLPISEELRAHFGSIRISAAGLSKPSLVFEDDAMRSYFSKLFEHWPEWMFLLDFEHEDVRPLVLTRLSRSVYMARDHEDKRSIQVLTTDIFEELIRPAGVTLWKLCRDAEMSEHEFRDRYYTILGKFGVKAP